MSRWMAGLFAALALTGVAAAETEDWRTPAEISDYTRTPDYAETLAWLKALDARCAAIELSEFGRSAQGRDLPLVVAARPGHADPRTAQRAGDNIVLIQAAIHPGENEGKDALMILLRELCFAPEGRRWLAHSTLLLMPIFNVDGHERRGPFNRINQNGPAELGWRTTATNLNLNRDYVKADTPEMRAWLRVFNAWQPHLVIDLHNTDGADYVYDSTYIIEQGPHVPAALSQWQDQALLGRAFAAVGEDGFKLAPYIQLVDATEPTAGIVRFIASPRFSSGYALARHRVGLIVENHMLKDFRRRTLVSVALLRAVLDELAARPKALPAAVAAAEAEARRMQEGVPLGVRVADSTRMGELEGYAYTRSLSEISGAVWIRYRQEQPQTWRLPIRDQVEVSLAVTPPAAWIIPAEWHSVIERLDAHGVESHTLAAAQNLPVELDRATRIAYATRPFEGRFMSTEIEVEPVRRTQNFVAGSRVVPYAQNAGRLALHMLDPRGPDSLLRWGFFHSRFEDKEYFEPRVMESLAREILAERPELRAAFEAKLADPAFAGSADARLRFFYEQSPWYDRERNVIPVARIDAATLARLREEGALGPE